MPSALLAVAAAGRAPAEVLADRARQLQAAVLRQKLHRLLDLRDPAARQHPAAEGHGFKGLDARIHGDFPEDGPIRFLYDRFTAMSQALFRRVRGFPKALKSDG